MLIRQRRQNQLDAIAVQTIGRMDGDGVRLQAALPNASAALVNGGALPVTWPKQSARMATNLTRDSLAARRPIALAPLVIRYG